MVDSRPKAEPEETLGTDLSLDSLAEKLDAVEERLASVEEAVHRPATFPEEPLGKYPQPIAYSIAEERAAETSAERFSRMLDVGDASIKYTAALALCLRWPDAGFRNAASILVAQPPTLGHWYSIIRLCKQLADDQPSPVAPRVEAELMTRLYRPNGKPTHANNCLEEMINLRNDEKGHAFTQSDAAYERLYRRNSVTLDETLNSLEYLELPLVKVEKMDLEAEDYCYRIRILAGESPIGRLDSVVSSCRLRPGTTCVWDRGRILIDLQGTLVHSPCDEACNLSHTFFFKKRTKQGHVEYQSPVGNHGITLQAPPWVDEIWKSLRGAGVAK